MRAVTTRAETGARPTSQPGGSEVPPRRAFVEQVMGLPVSVHVRGDVDRHDVTTAVGQVWGVLHRADAVFSTWRPDSDLMRLRRGEVSAAQVHPWLAEVEHGGSRPHRLAVGLYDRAEEDRSRLVLRERL